MKRVKRGARTLAVTGFLMLGWSATAHGATLEPIGTFANPVFVSSEPPDPDRVLVVEQAGRIQLREGGTTSLFLDITSLVQPGGEQGLLSMAPAPDYETSKRFFVFYVGDRGSALKVDEFTASSIPVDIATRRPVLSVPHTTAGNHNGGQLQFGPDDNLYVSTGDGGNTPQLAQDTSVLLGKVLRIDPDQSGTAPYTVPGDNPFVGVAGADEIWSYGLRNPFRFSFDRSTDALLIGDVGGAAREEVDYEPQPGAGRGDNFGWNCREGLIAGPGGCSGSFTDPIHDYPHTNGNCSIIGGYVSRDPGVPELAGRYLYADLCVGQIRSLVPGLPSASDDRSEGAALTVTQPTSFGQDSCGRLYVAELGGQVSRIVGSTPTDCSAPPLPPPDPDPAPLPEASPGEDQAPPPLAGSPGDASPPRLELIAKGPLEVGEDRRIACRVRADEAATAVARLAIVDRRDPVLRLGKDDATLDSGVTGRVSWRLDRDEARRLHRVDGALDARIRARAKDLAGNVGDRHELTVPLQH